MVECNHDCLNCPYPDVPEECLNAPLSYSDYKELEAIERDIINPKTARQRRVAAGNKAYYEANKERLSAKQKCIAQVRKAHGMTQATLASRILVSRATVGHWESGAIPANWDKLCAVLPELTEYRP